MEFVLNWSYANDQSWTVNLLLQKSNRQSLDIRVDVETKAIELTVEKLGKELAKEIELLGAAKK
jgi:DNA-binding GntR family transcriptional regulator